VFGENSAAGHLAAWEKKSAFAGEMNARSFFQYGSSRRGLSSQNESTFILRVLAIVLWHNRPAARAAAIPFPLSESSALSVRIAKKNQKKQRIQEAAIRIMAEHGYHGTTVSQIARAAGVADGTIYLYFENKDDLLIKTIDEIMDRFISEGLAILEKTASPMEKLKKFAELHLENLGADEELACIFQIELRHNLHFMKIFSETRMRKYFSYLEGFIAQAQDAGEIRGDIDPWLTAKIIFGALDEAATNWLLRKKDYNLITVAAPTLDILFNGIRAKPQG